MQAVKSSFDVASFAQSIKRGPRVLVAIAALLAAHAAGAAEIEPSAEMRHGLALEAQTEGNPTEMLYQLRLAAAEDHLRSQEMLGLILLAGPTLFGEAVAHNLCESRAWLERAEARGSVTGRLYVGVIRRQQRIRSDLRCAE